MASRPRSLSYGGMLPARERTISSTSLVDSDSTRRRSSSRAIKRPKFDDELVESSLGGQSSAARLRNPSISATPDTSVPVSLVSPITPEVRKRLPKSGRKTRRSRSSQSVVNKDLGRWKPTDDLALILGVQQTCDLIAVHRGVKFSCKFSLEEVQDRWYALLYDATISRIAQQAMKNLHPEQIYMVELKALFSKCEEDLLATVKSNSNPTLETFETLLAENPHVFFSSRSPKIIQAHWQQMKQYHLLPDQTVKPLQQDKVIQDFNEAEDQINDGELNESSDELLEHELMVANRSTKSKIKLLEDKVSQWQVVVVEVAGIPRAEFDNQTLAALRGRLVKYLMRSREISIGRKAPGFSVDVDLSLEGPAWKVSRKQGIIKLKNTGEFLIANEGRRSIFVDGKAVITGTKAKLSNNSVVEIASLKFIFLINTDLVDSIKKEMSNS